MALVEAEEAVEGRYAARQRRLEEQQTLAREALTGKRGAQKDIAQQIADDVRVTLYRRAMKALAPAVHETAERIAMEAFAAIERDAHVDRF